MPKLIKLARSSVLHWLIIFLLIGYQVIRLIFFINTYGGIEHDSGWFLGLARSLAETGTYTTMVSTIADPEPGGHENIYGQYNVQDKEGRVYFFTESGVYAAGIIPNALIIKLFGAGFWQYRAGPLLFLVISLLLASYLLYQVSGFLSVIIFQLFLFFYPHLIIFLGYEAMGEVFGLAYVLVAFVLFIKAVQVERWRGLWFLLCGLAAGLAITTKPISLLSLAGLPLVWGVLFWRKRATVQEGMMVAAGWLAIPLGWELTQLLSLTWLFDFSTYQHHLVQRVDFFSNEGGSGLGTTGSTDMSVFFHKLLMVREISLANDGMSAIVLISVLLSGPLLMWRYRYDPYRRNIVILLWSGWFIHSLWFVALAKNPWVRHDWYALLLAVLLLALVTAYTWRRVRKPFRWSQFIAPLFLTGILVVGFAGQGQAATLFVSDRLVDRWYHAYLADNYTRIPWSLVPRQAQQDAVDFITTLPAEARVFFSQGHKTAEMAVLTGRILYPIERRAAMPPVHGDVVLIGPSLISPWAKLMEKSMTPAERQGLIDTVINRARQECPQIVFENDYYMICALD